MKIYATFASRKYDPGAIELIDAWDEFCADENWTGFEESRTKAISSLGDDLLRWVTVEVDLDETAIGAALDPRVRVEGFISSIDGGA